MTYQKTLDSTEVVEASVRSELDRSLSEAAKVSHSATARQHWAGAAGRGAALTDGRARTSLSTVLPALGSGRLRAEVHCWREC